ncbi:MAG: sulfotransferase family protein [Planctomycetota bacterium]|jgi:hypothetical protein
MIRIVKRIHIVGCPRSGTTLALEAMANAFDIDGYASEERSFLSGLRKPDDAHRVFLSKRPRDYPFAARLLPREPEMVFIFLLRDPRDVVVSRHALAPERYWTHLAAWKRAYRETRSVQSHPRFIELRYEDLVGDPDATERRLIERMPFLEPVQPLREFFRTARPSNQANEALHGLRPLETSSIGRWREHRPRMVAQLELHGPITDELIEIGYESDDEWLRELDGVRPEASASMQADGWTLRQRLRRRYELWKDWRRYRRIGR